MARIITRKRKEIISAMDGQNVFFLVVREMTLERNDEKKFPCMDGGDITKDFEAERKPYIEKTLNAKLQNLRDKRKNETGKRTVRPSTKAPGNVAEKRSRPDFKEWVDAHDAELERHDTELRT